MFKRNGKGLSRDILLRRMAWEIQERAFGAYDSVTVKALARYTKEPGDAAQLKRHSQWGTVLVREHQGTSYTVTAL